jgi:DNA-binding transcriptional LysR family regulator
MLPMSSLAVAQAVPEPLDPPPTLAISAVSATGHTGSEAAEHDLGAHARWRAIEVRHFAALGAVAREGSFRRAADRLGYVQSAISSQIAHLERAAGTRLVERASGSGTVTLTGAGRVLLHHADEIMARFAAAYTDVSSLASKAAGEVRISGLERFVAGQFARIVRCFREWYPFAHVVLEDAGSDELNFQLLNAGTLDLVVAELPLTDGPFGHLVLEEDPYIVLVNIESPLATRDEPIGEADIPRLRLIVPTLFHTAAPIDARLCKLGIELRSLLSADTVATAQALVSAGLGEAIVPRSLIDPDDPKTVALELPDVLPKRTIVLAFHAERKRSTEVAGFIRAVTVACQAQGALSAV